MAAIHITATAAFRLRLADVARTIQRYPMRQPLIFGALVSAVKTGGSDYFTQRCLEGKAHIDKRRNAVFCLWGLLYLGGVQYFIQVKLFTQYLFPRAAAFVAKPLHDKLTDRAGQVMVAKQVGLDMFVHHPFVFFPAFYQAKELIEGGTPRDAVRKCWSNWGDDCRTLWAIWVPALTVNYGFCPVWARIPFVACVSAVYTCIFSFARGAPES